MFFRFFLHIFMYNYTYFGTFAEKMKLILYIMSKGTPKSPFFCYMIYQRLQSLLRLISL